MAGNRSNTERPWRWNKERREAAALLAADELTDQNIADRLSISRVTLWAWKQNPEFSAHVRELTERLGALADQYQITKRRNRLADYDRRRRLMQAVIEHRATEAQADPDAPYSAHTGLLARDVKMIGGGDTAERVETWTFDAALLKAILELEREAAVEVGHRKPESKDDENGNDDGAFWRELRDAARARLATRGGE